MRPLALLGLLAAIVLTGLSGCVSTGKTDHVPATVTCTAGSPFENTDQTYGLCIPSGWTARINQDGAELKMTTQLTDYNDPFQENMNIVRYRATANLTIDQAANATMDNIPAGVHNMTLLHRQEATLGGERAVRIEYMALVTYSANYSLVLYWDITMALHNGVVTQLTYTATPQASSIFRSGVDSTRASFVFL